MFSASLPPDSVAAVAQSLQIMKKEPERRLHLLRIAQLLRDELRSRRFNVLPGETAIVPVVIQDELDLCRLCKRLLEEGIYINPVLRPAAAQNLLRISCTAAHTEKHVERLISTLVKVAAELGIER
jgi:8-amino-7-oxononanoate synthase